MTWDKGHRTILRDAERKVSEMHEIRGKEIREMCNKIVKFGICPPITEHNHRAEWIAEMFVDKRYEIDQLFRTMQ